MLKGLIVALMLLIVPSTSHAEDTDNAGSSQCAGMARTLSLPDEKAFKVFTDLDEETVKREFGFKSNKHIMVILQQALDKGYGAGQTQGAINAYGRDFALKLFMKMCYKDDAKLRKAALSVK